ncbi:uncharacterized protein [Littorina saxatilis]|uniref:non-specific serine/threonine protein kinase n=2 Tax=Littorina saxatilis TaxID=31220 RepID=A0AAN9GB95_9CAEN
MIVDTNVIASTVSSVVVARSHSELPCDGQQQRAEVSLNELSALASTSTSKENVSDYGEASSSSVQPATTELEDDLAEEKEETKDDDEDDRSCCCAADDMAGDDQKAEKYIVDIPYSVLLSIYQSLDADKGWESLASETGYTFDKIRLLELEGARNQGSPSRSLLWELGSRNTTVRQLYGYLSVLSRFREMKLLEDYVNSPSKTSSVDNGLRGLKSPSSSLDSPRGNRFGGLSSPSSLSGKKSNNPSMNSDSINFNQPKSSGDVNNSMKFQEKDKHYSGKQIPMAPNVSPSPPTGGNQPASSPHSPASIKVPSMRPSNPSRNVVNSSSANIVRDMVRQLPGGMQSGSPLPPSHPSSQGGHLSSPLPSSESDSPISSGPFSSLPGLDSSLEAHMAVMGSVCFSYSEIVQATNNFSEQSKIGEGAFGTVYFGVLRHNKCAVKKMFEGSGQETVVERSTQVQRELTSLLKFRHENIVTLYGYASEGECLCLIYQFMPNGSLEDRLMCKNSTAPLVWSQRLNILLGACQGLNFLHKAGQQPLIHGDIKSANILLDKHMEAKIGDLGQAQQATSRAADSTTKHFTHITRAETSTKLYGTKAYQARELQTGGSSSVKSDVFAMGVVILEMFSGEKAYDERREGEQFLADYFRSLQEESGDEACLAKMDQRGGECPQEVALAVLHLANECTSLLKKNRPNSAKLLEKMVSAEKLYKEKAGIKLTNMDSMPGSERSCHLSHSSSADRSVPNLAGAPPHDLQPSSPPYHHQAVQQQPSSTFNVNLNSSMVSPKEKLYATQLVGASHEKKPDIGRPDNRLAVNLNMSASLPNHPARQDSQSSLGSGPKSLGTPSPINNPIACFPEGQPLPPAFRLQQAYDQQKETPEEEKRRISRLSATYPTKEIAWRQEEAEAFPQSDPAKLAALQQFDHSGYSAEEKEVNVLQSDPKKLAMLKIFDENLHHPTEESAEGQIQSPCQQDPLACDPQKLAYLRQFDSTNVGQADPATSSIVQQTQREEEQSLASDPRKLAALQHFDTDSHNSASVDSEVATVHGESLHSAAGNTPLVSQQDYVVVPSQREALEACKSMAQHQGPAQQPSLSPCNSAGGENVAFIPPTQQDSFPTASDAQASAAERQRNFFKMYNEALENMGEEDYDDEDFDDDDEEETYDNGGQDCEEQISNAVSEETSIVSQCTPSEEGATGASTKTGHHNRTPSEQDKTMLNYFKQKEQQYGKTFKKPAQASQC